MWITPRGRIQRLIPSRQFKRKKKVKAKVGKEHGVRISKIIPSVLILGALRFVGNEAKGEALKGNGFKLLEMATYVPISIVPDVTKNQREEKIQKTTGLGVTRLCHMAGSRDSLSPII
eukprot:Gb_15700 [translate_table: standard]